MDDAYRHFISARLRRVIRGAARRPFKMPIAWVAARHACILIDGQAYFHKIGRQHQLDDDLFQDIMHPSLRGFIAVTGCRTGRGAHAFGWPRDVAAPVIDPARLAAHFGLDQETWKHICIWQKGFNELVAPLRYESEMRLRKRDEGLAAAERLTAAARPESLELPNVGIPKVVPMAPFAEGEPSKR